MHLVYGRADLTLIAAAGADSTYGLPGVHKRRHPRPRSVRCGNITVCQVGPQAAATIAESVWNSRGWTYQEVLLTRRRLVFTDHFVIFQCNRDTFGEGIHLRDRTAGSEPFNLSIISRIVNARGSSDPGTQLLQLFTQITRYSTKQLTYESDRLNAFLGILGDQEALTPPIYHIWGVPVARVNMQWVLAGLAWFRDFPTSRESTLPSWSWTSCAGGNGGIRFWKPFAQYPTFSLPFRAWLATEDSCGPTHLISLETFASRNDKPHFYATGTRYLKLEGNVGTVSMCHISFLHRTHVWVEALGRKAKVQFYPDEPEYDIATPTGIQQASAFQLDSSSNIDERNYRSSFFMVIVARPDGSYRRIGGFAVTITLYTFGNHDPDRTLMAWHQGLKKTEIWVS